MTFNSINIERWLTEWVLAGRSLVCFGAVIVVASILSSYFFVSLAIDVVALIVISLGLGVAEGRMRSAQWALAIMAYYAVLSMALLGVALVQRNLLRVGNHAARAEDMPMIAAACAVLLIW